MHCVVVTSHTSADWEGRRGEGGGVMEGSLGSQGVSEQGAEISNEVI